MTEFADDLESPDSPPPPQSADTGKGSMDMGSMDFDPEAPEPEMQRATSVSYGGVGHHARQVSAGSAILLDVPPTPRRPSADVGAGESDDPYRL